MIHLLLAGGFVALIAGGEMLVRGAVALAQRLGLSPMVIGLTLVGFGTSTPELLTSVQAALAGSPGIALGNIVGSNICNILLILGLSAMLAPIAVRSADLKRDGLILGVATLSALAAILSGAVGRLVGVGFVAALVGFVALVLVRGEAEGSGVQPEGRPLPAWAAAGLFVAGLALTILGAGWLVDGAIGLARGLGVSEAVIGLTIVAVGTSLPELVTSVVAALRRQADIAFGNIIGSNIFNIFGILGVTALIRPLEVPAAIVALDGWVMLAATVALVVVAMTGLRITRTEGAALLTSYGVYLGVLATTA